MDRLSVVKLEVVPVVLVYKSVPPDSAEYHWNTPLTVEDAPNVTVPVPHRLALIPDTEVSTTCTVTCTLGLVHVPSENST